jgi:geranylgeranyl reductase family protein
MPVSRKIDLLIIGGGPAGAGAAIHAKQLRPDWQVVLIDKDEFPRDKVCGDGLGPHAVNEISRLGADGVLGEHLPIHSLRLDGPGGLYLEDQPYKPLYALRRFELDAGLVRCAQELGVEVLVERVDSISTDSTGVTVNDVWRAPFVIAADGANSRTRRLCGLPFASGHDLAFSVRGYLRSDVTALTITWQKRFAPSYSWAFPVGDGYANVGFGCLKSALPEKGSKPALWEAAAEFTGIDATDSTLRAHHLPFSSARLERSSGRVLFVGDSAGLINPLSGEGIYYALASGRLAASALALEADPIVGYSRNLNREFRSHFRSTSLCAAALHLGIINLDAVILAGQDHKVFEDLVELMLGDGTVTPTIVTGILGGWLKAIRRGG